MGYARRLVMYAPCWIGWDDLYQEGMMRFLETGVVWDGWQAMADVLRKYGKWNRAGRERVEEIAVSDVGVNPALVVEVNQLVSRLPKRERLLLRAFHEGRKQKEVAAVLGCTEARVSQLRKGIPALLAA